MTVQRGWRTVGKAADVAKERNQRHHRRPQDRVEISLAALEAGSLTPLRSSGCADRIGASLSACPIRRPFVVDGSRPPHHYDAIFNSNS
jgi:hypothetical protein